MTVAPETGSGAAKMAPLPTLRADVDIEFVTGALKAGGCLGATGEVTELTQEPFGAGIAISGQLVRLRLRYAGA